MAIDPKEYTRDPYQYRGSAGGINTFSARFPLNEGLKFFVKMDFYEYKRAPESANPDRKHTGSLQLPIPQTINDVSSIKISEVDHGLAAVLVDLAIRGGNAVNYYAESGNLGELWDRLKETGAKGWEKILQGVRYSRSNPVEAAAIINSLVSGSTDGLGAVYGGVIRNPHTTATFNGVALKSYSFEWKLSPRNEKEAKEIERIVKILKERSHPSISPVTKFALEYPDLVTLSFEGLKNVPKVNFSFIENVNVVTNPTGQGFYKDGQPIETQISISLKEIDIRTRENINN